MAAAIAARQDEAWMLEATAKVRLDRTFLVDHLHQLGVSVVPSQTNALFQTWKPKPPLWLAV
ncbi:hypothetical protein EN816_24530 [Mesorhizobium sp. M8A.F.Ca.ET.173.01.1.1]|nr:hypothetical protein EN816_24530 [Mesorhizobium sp. M8A.F.Ca.ET.173.01.1.1]